MPLDAFDQYDARGMILALGSTSGLVEGVQSNVHGLVFYDDSPENVALAELGELHILGDFSSLKKSLAHLPTDLSPLEELETH